MTVHNSAQGRPRPAYLCTRPAPFRFLPTQSDGDGNRNRSQRTTRGKAAVEPAVREEEEEEDDEELDFGGGPSGRADGPGAASARSLTPYNSF